MRSSRTRCSGTARRTCQYRDDQANVFLDGNSNLVIRQPETTTTGTSAASWSAPSDRHQPTAPRPDPFNCPTAWLLAGLVAVERQPERGGEVDLVEWYGNGEWPSGTGPTPDWTASRSRPSARGGQQLAPVAVHLERLGMYFWMDYVDGAEPYFGTGQLAGRLAVQRSGLRVGTVLNLAVGGPAVRIRSPESTRPTCWSTGSACSEPSFMPRLRDHRRRGA